MAEQNKDSTSADSKEKKSPLDDEIGKEFLGSWKSISMADDDAMDFSFDTISKGKKKPFDFEKLDMDFNLDGEFKKLSSFKLDMSDLDFTCPPKKNSQSKDKKGEVSGVKAGKQDAFNFNFDFNELDNFNLDSSFMNVDAASDCNPRKKEVITEGSDKEAAKVPKINDNENAHASEKLETLKVETMVDNPGNLVSKQDGSVPKISSSGNIDMPIENHTLDINKRKCVEVDEERDRPEKTILTESKSEQVMACSQSVVGQYDSKQHTISEQHPKVFSSGTRVLNVSGEKQEVNDTATYESTKRFSSGTRVINVSGDRQEVIDKATDADSDSVDSQIEHSSPHHITESDSNIGEAINLGGSTQRVTDEPHPEKMYTSCENIKNVDALKNISCDNDNRVCHLAPESSKPVVEKMMLKKDKKLQDVQSNMFSMPEDRRSLKQPTPTIGSRENFKSNDSRLGSKLVGDTLTNAGKSMRDAAPFLGSKDDLKSSSNTRENIVSDVTPCSQKLSGDKQSFFEEVNKSKTTFLESGMSSKDVSTLSSQVNLSSIKEKTARITTQVSLNSQSEASGKDSSQKLRITSIEGIKLSSSKACKITPSLSNLKTSRNFGANRILITSLHQKEKNSSVSSGHSMEVHGISTSKNEHPIDSGDSKKPSTTFLKRKNPEVSPADFSSLRPLKLISQSPSKSRNCKESSEEVVGEVESMPNNLLYNRSNPGLKSPSGSKVMEMKIPDSVLMEDNRNVEKAEAYMKELEEICNMLKKKHEEAKELLIRAIVNDNNLLMLNHPIYEEEIRKAQKFASQLMSKGIQT